jgi:hypothetical protein
MSSLENDIIPVQIPPGLQAGATMAVIHNGAQVRGEAWDRREHATAVFYHRIERLPHWLLSWHIGCYLFELF